MPSLGQPGGDPQRHPHPVAEGDDRQVLGRADAVDPGPADRHVPAGPAARRRVRRQPLVVALGVQVTGVVERDRLQEDADAAVHRGRGQAGAQHRRGVVGAAPAPRAPGRGCRAARPPSCRCGSARRSPPGTPARPPAPPSGCGTRPAEKNCIVAASPRSWSSALCRYARYWISGTGSSPPSPAPSPSPRIDVSSSRVSKTRAGAEPVAQPLGDPVHAALGAPRPRRRRSSPGWSSMRVGERRVDRLGQGQRPGLLGQPAAEGARPGPRRPARPPAAPASATVRATRTGRRGRERGDDLGRAGQLGLAEHLLGDLADLPADLVVAGDAAPPGVASPASTSSRAVPTSGSRARSRSISVGGAVRRPRRPRRRGPSAGPCAGAARPGGGARRTQAAASRRRVVRRRQVAAVGGEVADARAWRAARRPPSRPGSGR